MAKSATLNIRIEPEVKEKAEQLYSQFGITVTDAINLFIHQSIIEGGIPFQIKSKQPNKETIEAMNEANQIIKNSDVKTYLNFSDLLAEVEDEI